MTPFWELDPQGLEVRSPLIKLHDRRGPSGLYIMVGESRILGGGGGGCSLLVRMEMPPPPSTRARAVLSALVARPRRVQMLTMWPGNTERHLCTYESGKPVLTYPCIHFYYAYYTYICI